MKRTVAVRRVVIKIGSALMTVDGRGLYRERIQDWSEQIVSLKKQGVQIAVVSSGAIAEGMVRCRWRERPTRMDLLQMAASVGQIGLLACWESCFSKCDTICGQILLSREDMAQRDRYLNAHGVMTRMLEEQVVPVINENDAVAIDEIRMGDNDTLAARVVNLLNADMLLILTDQRGICESDPRVDANAPLIERTHLDDPRLHKAAGEQSGALGRGGARTKITAAQLASRSGAFTVIAHGLEERVIERVVLGESVGTLIEVANGTPDKARKRWLAGLERCGHVVLDQGAVKALGKHGNSLLAVGVLAVFGQFSRGDALSCLDTKCDEVACGLSNYSREELVRISGQESANITKILGYTHGTEIIHRDNLVLLGTHKK